MTRRTLAADDAVQLDLIRRTAPGKDDDAWVKERQIKLRSRLRETPAVPDGPCCQRCAHWRAPGRSDDFGECRRALVVTRGSGKFERGTVVTVAEAAQLYGLEGEPMRTKPWFAGCSRYEGDA